MLESGGEGSLLALSEPDFFPLILHILRENHGLHNLPVSVDSLLLAGFRLQCKPILSKPHIKCYLIKSHSVVIALVPAIVRACPFVEHIWNYRAPTKTIASYQSIHSMLNTETKMGSNFLAKILNKLSLLPPHPPIHFCVQTLWSLVPEGHEEGAHVVKRFV